MEVSTNEIQRSMKFVQLSQIVVDAYNNWIWGIEVADHLRGVYRMDQWVRS